MKKEADQAGFKGTRMGPILEESGGICERKTLFQIKKEADQAGFNF